MSFIKNKLFLISIILLISNIYLIKKKTNLLCANFVDVIEEKECKDKDKIDRVDFIELIDKNIKTLEIGPYYSPTLKGSNVKYFDVLNKDQLILKAKDDNLDISNIPDIDYVEPHGDLDIINEKFDIVYSSHNIEHQVDLINHLQQVSKLLKDGGKFYLFVPDKRYCFDHFISETPLSDVIATHVIGNKSHSLQTILAMNCETTHNHAANHWKSKSGNMIAKDNLQCYKSAIDTYQNANESYIDAHKWRFTPESFENIIKSLIELKYIDLKIEKIYCTKHSSHEFSVILSK